MIVLASQSPRRLQLLQAAGYAPHVRAPAIVEQRRHDEDPVAYARRLAVEKALAVHTHGGVTIAADTVVHIDGETFEKPTDDHDSRRMLVALSGRWHQVTTAWCIQANQRRRGHSTTRVRFRDLDSQTIDAYVASGEGRDKAGSYAIQGQGMALVDRISGCYTTVVGLPLPQVLIGLLSLDLHPTRNGA